MSWRTQGHYRGLGDAEREWLKDFDRQWDTKAEGRSRGDAFDHMKAADTHATPMRPKAGSTIPRLSDLPAVNEDDPSLEVKLLDVAGRISRFTIPKRSKNGWSIHLVLTSGKRVRAKFSDKDSALQAYLTLHEYSVSILMS